MESKLDVFVREALANRAAPMGKDLDDGVAVLAVLYDVEPLIPLLGFGWYGEEIMNSRELYRATMTYLREQCPLADPPDNSALSYLLKLVETQDSFNEMLYKATRRGYVGFDANSTDVYRNGKYILTSKGRQILLDSMEIVPQFFNVVDDFAIRHKYLGMP
jgi:hypothetical protein